MCEKSTMLETLKSYVNEMEGWGRKVRFARCDATTVVGKEFLAAAHELGIRIAPTAAEDQRDNPVEASYGKSIKHDAALLIISQEYFTAKDWMLAIIRACINSNTTVHGEATETPLQQVTGKIPSYRHITKFGFDHRRVPVPVSTSDCTVAHRSERSFSTNYWGADSKDSGESSIGE